MEVEETLKHQPTQVYMVDSSGEPSPGHDAQPKEWPEASPTASPTPAPKPASPAPTELQAPSQPSTAQKAQAPTTPALQVSSTPGAASTSRDPEKRDATYFRILVYISRTIIHRIVCCMHCIHKDAEVLPISKGFD